MLGMFDYITDLSTVHKDPRASCKVSASGHDLLSLVYNTLDECLYLFATSDTVLCDVRVSKLDMTAFKVELVGCASFAFPSLTPQPRRARSEGEAFSLSKHPQGTEVKAITYSNMQVHEEDGRVDVFVIIDI